jgi:predicted nicotinamide N-methyase
VSSTPTTVAVTVVACDETAVMAGKNALSNDEDKSSTIPKQTDIILLYDVMYDTSVVLRCLSYLLH